MQKMDEEFGVDVVVIGAGISGLTAAYHLLKKDPSTRVTVLEAKDRVGGRTLTQQLKASGGDRDAWDLGGQWVGRTQPHIMQLLTELSLETHDQYITGTKFMRLGTNKISTYKSILPSLSYMGLIDLHMFMNKIERLRKLVPVDDPFSCEFAEEWDNMTLEAFKQRTCWTQDCKEAMDAAVRVTFGTEASQMSFLFFLLYVNAADGVEKLFEAAKNCGQEYRIKGGAQQISLKLMEAIGKENVWLSHPVAKSSQDEAGVTLTTVNGKKIHCNRAIMATPPCQTGKIIYEPCLPVEKTVLFDRMPIGYLLKFIVTYETAFWREDGYSGEIASNTYCASLPLNCTLGPLSIIYDCTTANDKPALVGFISGLQYVQWCKLEADNRKQGVLNALVEFFGPKSLDCLEYVEKDWREEPYNGGCPVSAVQPGAMTHFSVGLRQPYNRIHFAGTESATVWCGFMNGAVQAGIRAANEVLYHLRPQVISSEELAELSYVPKTRKSRKCSKKRKIMKLAMIVGVCTAAVVIIRRTKLSW